MMNLLGIRRNYEMRNMLVMCFFGYLLLGLATTVTSYQPAQNAGSSSGQSSSRLDVGKPSVYLAFEGETVAEWDCPRGRRSVFVLSLHNNSPTPINVDAVYDTSGPAVDYLLSDGAKVAVLPNGSKVKLCYDVEALPGYSSKVDGNRIETEIPVRYPVPDVVQFCSCKWNYQKDRPYNSKGLWIPPRGHVIFTVPQEYLTSNLKIFTLFNYEWEFRKGEININEPHHQVFFYSSDLPSKSRRSDSKSASSKTQ